MGLAQVKERLDGKVPIPVCIDQVGVILVSTDDEVPHCFDRVVRDDSDTLESNRTGEAYRGGRHVAHGLRACQRDSRRFQETIDFDFIRLVVSTNQDGNDVIRRCLVEQGLDESIG